MNTAKKRQERKLNLEFTDIRLDILSEIIMQGPQTYIEMRPDRINYTGGPGMEDLKFLERFIRIEMNRIDNIRNKI